MSRKPSTQNMSGDSGKFTKAVGLGLGQDTKSKAEDRGEYTDSGLCSSYGDSGCNIGLDSGFLSGSIASSECISEEISPSRKYTDSSSKDYTRSSSKDYTQRSTLPDEDFESKSYGRLDSGVDVGFSDQFSSSLSLKNTSLNDLDVTSKTTTESSKLNDLSSTKSSASNLPSIAIHPSTGWESYFQQDEDGDTNLHVAIVREFIEVVDVLIRMAPHSRYLDIKNNDWHTPLHIAVLMRRDRIIRHLVAAGASGNKQDRYGNTPLHLACEMGYQECVEALTEPLYNTATGTVLPQDLEVRNYEGQMCVHVAAMGGHVDTLRHLYVSGANINAREGKSGHTVLHYAIESGLHRVIRFLLEECLVGLLLETPTYAGKTAFQLAEHINPALADYLVTKGATRNHRDESDSESDTAFSDEEA